MAFNLHADMDDYKTHKVCIAAKYVGLDIQTMPGSEGSGRIPVLETEQGCVFSILAIARYIARMRRDINLMGTTAIETGLVDSWLEFLSHDLEVPLCVWIYQKRGMMEVAPLAESKAKEDVAAALTVLNNHLLSHTYMVGHQITLVDISLCCALVEAHKFVFDPAFVGPYGNVARWLATMLAQPVVAEVLGKVDVKGGAGAGKAPAAKAKAEAKAPKAEAKAKGSPKAEPKDKAKPKAEPKAKEEGGKKKDKKGKAPAEEKDEAPAPTPEELEKMKKDKLKKVMKEGGKRGVEIEGAADMGGLQFFCTSVDAPEGDIELVVKCLEAMNAESDPSEEERKGGSGAIGKMIFSVGVEQLAVAAYVPQAKQKELSCAEWLEHVIKTQGGQVLKKDKSVSTGIVKTNSDKGIFPLKIREPMILEANGFLRKKGLFPEDNSDDDEMVFGDDDFPS